MNYTKIKLPEDREKLVGCYLYLSIQLRSLWVEYVNYAEEVYGPTNTEIFRIIFSEMDFFEGLRGRIAKKLPEDLIKSLRNVDDFSSW